MNVRQLMTPDPACCTPATTVQAAARMMMQYDCGELPVVETQGSRKLVGVVTDRDIVSRSVAAGDDPAEATVARCMSTPVMTVRPETSLEECIGIMEQHQIRRVPVVDGDDVCCGIIAQADIAARAAARQTAELVKEVSRPV
jgi:CBS domain-containing protein